MTCFIPAGQTAADPHEQGQQSCPLHQEKVLTTGSLSTSHQQEWVPNKRHDFKWISQWTLNVWSEVSDSAVRSPAEEHVKSRARSEPNATEGALWPQEGMIFGRTFNMFNVSAKAKQWAHFDFYKKWKWAQVRVCNIQEVSPVSDHWTSNMDDLSELRERHSGAGGAFRPELN